MHFKLHFMVSTKLVFNIIPPVISMMNDVSIIPMKCQYLTKSI